MKFRFLLVFVLCTLLSFAQTSSISPPNFPGGNDGIHNFLMSKRTAYNIDPVEAKEGYVYVSSLLNQKGKIDSLWVVQGVDSYRDKEVLRMVRSMPKWKAARKDKEKVFSQVNFVVGYFYDVTEERGEIDRSLFIKHPKAEISLEPICVEFIDYIQPQIAIGNDIQLKIFYSNGVDALNNGNFEDAILSFTNALSLNPKDKDSLYNRGVAYYKSGQKDKGCEDWTKAGELGDTEAAGFVSKYCED